jgi:hypothetical protein
MMPKTEKEAEKKKRVDSEEDEKRKRSRWLCLLREAEVIAANLKESGTRR